MCRACIFVELQVLLFSIVAILDRCYSRSMRLKRLTVEILMDIVSLVIIISYESPNPVRFDVIQVDMLNDGASHRS